MDNEDRFVDVVPWVLQHKYCACSDSLKLYVRPDDCKGGRHTACVSQTQPSIYAEIDHFQSTGFYIQRTHASSECAKRVKHYVKA